MGRRDIIEALLKLVEEKYISTIYICRSNHRRFSQIIIITQRQRLIKNKIYTIIVYNYMVLIVLNKNDIIILGVGIIDSLNVETSAKFFFEIYYAN